jgi:hypothetical protein
MALCRGLCSPGDIKYSDSIVRVSASGMIQVCLKHSRFHRPRNRLAFLRFRPRSFPLPLFGYVGESTAGGVADLRSEVASALAPVSPRGSAPRLELLRRRRVAIPFGFGGFWLRLEIAGNDSVYCDEAIMGTRSDWRSEVGGWCAGQIISIAPASCVIKFPFSVSLVTC